ncbi:MAG TPA: TolC family protein [Verrucomicrobiae bacterium]
MPGLFFHSDTLMFRAVRTSVIIAAFAFVLVATAAADTTNQPRQLITKADCIRAALEHNLDIKIERYVPEIARYNLNIGYAAYEPVFSSTATHSYDQSPGGIDQQNQPYPGAVTKIDAVTAGFTGLLPFGTSYSFTGDLADTTGENSGGPLANTGGAASIQATQPLLKNLWIDAPRMTIQVNKKLLRYSELALRLQIMTTVTAVESAYYDLILAEENVKVQRESLQLAEKLFTEDKRRVEVGSLARLDEKQAESQVAASQATLLDAERAMAAQQNVVKLLIIDDTASWRNGAPEPSESLIATPQDFDLNKSWQKAFTQRPDLLQSRVDLERQGIVVKYLRNQLFPELDLVGSYGHNASESQFAGAFDDLRRGDSPFYSYGAALTVPLGNGNARNNYKIGKATRGQLLLRLKQLELQTMSQVEDAVKLAQTDLQRVEATRQSRLFAETALDAEQKKMETGKSTSFFVLQLQRDLTAARSAEVQALADYNIALVQLAFNEGTTLERNKLDLEVK